MSEVASYRISDNHVTNSSNTNITHHVYNGAGADELQVWLSSKARKVHSRHISLPEVFVPGFTRHIARQPDFQACLSQKAASLMLRGSMGAGKTTTIRGLVRDLREVQEVAVAYVLFDFHLPTGHESQKVLMRFVDQLADLKDEEQRSHVLDLHDRYSKEWPSADEIAEMLIAVIQHLAHTRSKAICIFLDGLDEFIDQSKLSNLLRHLAKVQAQTNCGLVMTSRLREVSVTSMFGQCPELIISAYPADVKTFVRGFAPGNTVARLKAERGSEFIEDIANVVTAGARGLFLLATLNTAYIMNADTEDEFRAALKQVSLDSTNSTDLDEAALEHKVLRKAFDRHIDRLFVSDRHTEHRRRQARDARDILAFMRDAIRPLNFQELLHLLALRDHRGEFGAGALRDPNDLAAITQGLMYIGKSGSVHFIHPWLKTYLQIPRRRIVMDSNAIITQSCLRYLLWHRFTLGPCGDNVELDKRLLDSPLLSYAAKSWTVHYAAAMETLNEDCAQSLRAIALVFLRCDASVSTARQVMLLSDHATEVHSDSLENVVGGRTNSRTSVLVSLATAAARPGSVDPFRIGRTTGLHLAAALSLNDLATNLTADANKEVLSHRNGLGQTPLHEAVIARNRFLVELLVRQGAILDACNDEGLSPWHIAAALGSVDVMEIMMGHANRDFSINGRVRPRASRWHGQAYETTSLQPQAISIKTERALSGCTALHLAARNGHVDVVKLIMSDERVETSIEDDDGMTTFHKACKYGHIDVVKLLISFDSSWPERRSNVDGRTGLHLACKYKAGFEVAKWLLQHHTGCCDIRDRHSESALHHAAAGEDSRSVQLLLDHSMTDVHALNDRRKNALVLAAFNPNEGFDMFLRSAKVDRKVRIGTISVAEFVVERKKALHRQAFSQAGAGTARRRSDEAFELSRLADRLSETVLRPFTPETWDMLGDA
ncbi:hypothetical protein LTR78_004851 [Recurvomyces mirabilis]|uniref:Nephrocystin 3-like N-terminal domain-containing protein n=1 Tax=Recurvomyces mirabilis TaxID=574656 RepID=A0AAE0WP15_9PEZI|nr:hypothetical protein LTR78_004851 [Recurvomyces mirabilis]KAK5158022.1 hypothetical protein LTS14_003945 [Recurvomyces mirabilis]